MAKSSKVHTKLITKLYDKFGLKPFRFTDLQRAIVEMHGLDYDEFEACPIDWDARGRVTKTHKVRKHRGWYCDAIYPSGFYYQNSRYLYQNPRYLYDNVANGVKLVKLGRGKYCLVNAK